MSSWGIRQPVESENKPASKCAVQNRDLVGCHDRHDTIRIKYASKHAGSSNYWKNALGMNEALNIWACCTKRSNWKSDLTTGYRATLTHKVKYDSTLVSLQKCLYRFRELARYTTYFLETFNIGIEIDTLCQYHPSFRYGMGLKKTNRDSSMNDLLNLIRTMNPPLDKQVLPVLMKLYAERVPQKFIPTSTRRSTVCLVGIMKHMPTGSSPTLSSLHWRS